jgi:hypothetical protein
MPPGKIPLAQRPRAFSACSSTTKTYWRSVATVRVDANGDVGNNQGESPEQLLSCHY